jgi:hypothetical protein
MQTRCQVHGLFKVGEVVAESWDSNSEERFDTSTALPVLTNMWQAANLSARRAIALEIAERYPSGEDMMSATRNGDFCGRDLEWCWVRDSLLLPL